MNRLLSMIALCAAFLLSRDEVQALVVETHACETRVAVNPSSDAMGGECSDCERAVGLTDDQDDLFVSAFILGADPVSPVSIDVKGLSPRAVAAKPPLRPPV